MAKNHHAYQLYAHITWHTWKRYPCLKAWVVPHIWSAVASACERCGTRVLRGAVLTDHVHLLVSYRPDTRLGDFVRVSKSVAARRANRDTFGAVRWARGFYAGSVSKSHLVRVTRYIAAQHRRHADRIPGGRVTPGSSRD